MFITLEGPEGAGKSTLQRSLAEALRQAGHEVVETREPGATATGHALRQILLESPTLPARAELFLFLADRANHVDELIRPALFQGAIVISDRFADSTVVYQGDGRGFDRDALRAWNHFATGGLAPDLTLLLDLDPEVGIARGLKGDRMDQEPLEFHRRIRDGFLREAEQEPDRWVVLDAARPAAEVHQAALSVVQGRLSSAAKNLSNS
ncbi:MAG TPA: dTMP kinase [Fimbriimonadaceae bacterium]|nr:dTMP kinase [Fimbriimonadaceae bacterium]HRJ32247.1 dTMP kinase [Fimbriimonadaceae bacterium]